MKKIICLLNTIIIIFLFDSFNNSYSSNKENNIVLESGFYKIVLSSDPTKSLTVDGGKVSNGTNVHIWNYLDVKQQQFKIKYDDEGFCEIIPLHSEKRLDVAGWGNEANVNQWEYNGGNDNQKWIIRKSEKGNYNIISKRQNLYLDAYQSKTENGTNIQVYESSGGSGQEFKIEKIDINKPIEDDDEPEPPIEEYKPENPIEEKEKPEKTVENGTYKIVMAKDNEQSITVDGGKNNNGVNIHLWKYVNVAQQQFNLVCDDEGYYEIIPINSGKRIDLAGWGNEANVDQWENNGGNDNQKWIIKKNKNGNYNIISKRQNLYLDAYQSKIQNGTNIEGYERSGGEGQEFKLEKIENVSERTIEDGIYKIAMQSNKNIVVEAAGSNTDNDGILQIWKDYNVRAQKVKIEYENGYYKIFMVHSGKCFTVKYRNISSGTDIIQYEWNNGENQKWIIRDNGNGCYGIMPLSDESLAINIAGNIENGSILKLYNNQDINEKFVIIKEYDRYVEEGTYGWTGLKVKGNGEGGEFLHYYKIGNGNKKIFVNFSIHGFEDLYNYDGQELTYIADEFFRYLKDNLSEKLVNKWMIYIFPTANPDGQHYGWTNNGPGRTTLYSWAPNNKGIDMNRCFPVGYKSLKDNRNYSGTMPLQAYEAENLKNFILYHVGDENIVIDVHGWLNETIGDNDIGRYYRNQYGINNHIWTYGNGYFIQWARSIKGTRSMLLELPEIKNRNQLIEKKYVEKFTNATIQLLEEF